jgi:hypothetical protein
MANMNSLNTLLAGVVSAETLIEHYRIVCPRALEPNLPGESDRDALNYCSGAAEFVMGYLTVHCRAVRGRAEFAGLNNLSH